MIKLSELTDNDTKEKWTDADVKFVMNHMWWKGMAAGVLITVLGLSFVIGLGLYTDY